MRLIKFAPLMLLIGMTANAMDVQMGNRLPAEMSSDLEIEENGKKTVIEGPWLLQSLNIVNTSSTETLEINYIEAYASCLDESNSEYVSIHATTFDPEDMTVQLHAGGPAFSTGDMYVYGLPDCSNGHIVKLEVSGYFLDSNGDQTDYDDSSVTFITQ